MTQKGPGSAASAIWRRLVGLLLVLFAAVSTPVLPAGSFTSAVETIHKRELRQHCEFLASDTLEGRETGTHGGEAAGAYIVGVLRKEKHALPAAPDGDYFQPFPPNSRNILVRIPGGDAALRREYVVVGAHYDHVGYGNSRNSRGPIGYIHNGADDNASGTAALLELVDAFCSLDLPTKRSLLFIFWDGEEAGLLGSQYWMSAPTVPLDRIRLVFNIDMIGRLRENRAEVFGSRSAPGLRRFLSSQNTDSPPVALNFTWETHRDSDHYSFFAQQIPYLMVFTGKHPDYHTPYDDAEKLNVDGMERITRLLFRAIYAAAQQAALPPFRAAAFHEGAQAQAAAEAPLPDPPARLGVTWDEARAKQTIQLTEIDSGSAAESAGLQPGDRLVAFDGTPIAAADDLREAVLAAGDPATAVVERNGQKSPQALTVHLHGSPEPTGISCRVDEAEPGCVIVRRVASGSPASRAGVRVNDRIQKVARSTVGSLQEFGALLADQHGPFEIQIERDGDLKVLHVTPIRRQTGRKILLSSPR
jgi:hypothetical protein